jgi:hypothetical protein
MYEPQGADPVTNEQVDIIETRYRDALRHAEQECDTNPDVNAIYDQLKQCGYSYGETFRGITALSCNPHDTSTVVGDIQCWNIGGHGLGSAARSTA